MKKAYMIICGLLVCIMLSLAPSIAETVSPDITKMSIEELLNLRDEIDALLEEKGYAVYFDIERGAKGEEVSSIQEKLSELGYYTGKITGKYDSETQKAFKSFEKANGIENDGIASREDQIILFGDSVFAKETMNPTNKTTPVPAKKSEHDRNFDYEHCMRYPNNHVGETYKLKGRVEQTLGNRTEGFQIRFSVLGNSDEIIYVYINHDLGYNILENDWLIIDLMMSGTITYESIWGQEITIPAALASEVVLK